MYHRETRGRKPKGPADVWEVPITKEDQTVIYIRARRKPLRIFFLRSTPHPHPRPCLVSLSTSSSSPSLLSRPPFRLVPHLLLPPPPCRPPSLIVTHPSRPVATPPRRGTPSFFYRIKELFQGLFKWNEEEKTKSETRTGKNLKELRRGRKRSRHEKRGTKNR